MQVIDKDRRGMVLRIERSSIFDGSGFRTVVFFKGCPLRCQWCSTPESQSFQIEKTEQNVYGSEMSVEEVMREIRKDSLFYFISSGGVTLSGGEALSQPEFALALLTNAKKECFNTAIETSFFAPWESISPLLPYLNTIFVDLKLFSADRHLEYCGVDNQLILDNLLATNESTEKFTLLLRIPLIPGVNDSTEELEAMGAFCAKLTHLSSVQLLPYHRLGTATYKKLGRPYLLEDVPTPDDAHMEVCRDVIRRYIKTVQ